MEEIGSGDSDAAQRRFRIVENIPILETTENAVELSRILIAEKAIPKTSTEDALHIGIAAVQGMDFLLTWGFYNFARNFFSFHYFSVGYGPETITILLEKVAHGVSTSTTRTQKKGLPE
uniref:Uncharacterized protein n=1 Tax=Candidatus Kentrum sp. UNK TaxID=2126344 RepID=A0A451AAD7_9GAMM|nr:MAG: hypothetical protein BECKUNK1418G_GA0071005_102835 [Candidatus Kentron sp. UNK]VFK70682.1 MAG: hypothetical protein BECKUNK1418H_GA0071006_103535 [Candidatus Kentron sp. UNK]